jgi:hypothetical protein
MNFDEIATTYLYKGNICRLKAILLTKQATKYEKAVQIKMPDYNQEYLIRAL